MRVLDYYYTIKHYYIYQDLFNTKMEQKDK